MSSDPYLSRTIGNYEITERLGKGGMATVYRAHQSSMQRDVAIKIMSADLADDPQFVARFEREAQVIASLEHPRILPVHDFGHEGDMVYLVMRLIDGSTLYQRLLQGPLPLKTTRSFLSQMAEALDYAHAQGVIHRDLKPNNILIDAWDNLYLMDFGLAKLVAASQNLTATGAVLGTPAYMAPEQWRGEPVDRRADIYALGVILYEMVLGHAPFESDTPYTLMYKHLNDAPPAPRTELPTLPESIEKVILHGLAKDPDDRYPTAGALARDFAAALRAAGPEVDQLQALIPVQKPASEDAPAQAHAAQVESQAAAQADSQAADQADSQGAAAPTDSQGAAAPVAQSAEPEILPPAQIKPPPPSVPPIPVPPGRKPKSSDFYSMGKQKSRRIERGRSRRHEFDGRKPKHLDPDAPNVIERLKSSPTWKQAMEAMESVIEAGVEKAADAAPLDENVALEPVGARPLNPPAFDRMLSILTPQEPLLGVLDVRGTTDWQVWKYLTVGGFGLMVLGGMVGAGVLSTLGVLAWIYVFVQSIRTWRGQIGRYFLGFTPHRVILLPRDAEGRLDLNHVQSADWSMIDRLRLTDKYIVLDVPPDMGRPVHFGALVLPQGEGGLGYQQQWLPGSPITALIDEKGFEVRNM